ncbi:Steroid 5-alpha reductase family enzyme [Burkholderia sp. OK233]|nr:Steroid 5-alpha reductase family enzyme [Burkholderia sp. OK233]
MPPLAAAVIALIGLVLIFSAVWTWQLKTGNAGMVDPVWAYSLGLVAVFYAVLGNGDPVSRALTALGGLVWGVRLGTHLWKRNFGKPEDARYRRFRKEWGDKAASKMFWFFQVQVAISMLLSIAFLVPSYRSSPPAIGWIVLAVVVWIASVVGEGIADRQLKRFTRDPANHSTVCRVGLWRYSRHPNYFFECVHWLAYIALSIGTPWGWFTLLPPVLMAFLLLKLSGIPLLEESMAKRRAGYADYMRTTSALIPWPPRH